MLQGQKQTAKMLRLCFGESTSRLLNDPYFTLDRHRDRRNSSVPLRIHTSTHSEDINLLVFHPNEPRLLLSGSGDGLLSISNALEDDEDEAVVHVGNWGCSVSRAGWSLPAEEIWSHSDMETLATWNTEVRRLSPPLGSYGCQSDSHRVRTLRFFFCSLTKCMTSGTFAERRQWSGIRTIWSMYATENPMGLGTGLGAGWPSWQEPIGK